MRTLHVLEFIRSFDGVWSLPSTFVDSMRSEFPGVEFSSPRDAEEVDGTIADAEVVLGWAVKPRNFERAWRLRWVHVTAAGVGPMLFPEMVASDVVLTNGRGLHSVAMAEHTLGVLLAFARKLHLARDAQRDGRWIQDALWLDPPAFGQLGGTTLGLVGLGSTGRAIAERARPLGMRVIAVRRHPAADPSPADEQWGVDRLHEMIAASDAVVLAAPLTAESRGMIDAAAIARMKPGAVLVNLGRGALVDEAALTAALVEGRIAGAALDVFENEPLAPESALWSLPQVIVTPHVSGFGPRYWERAVEMFTGNLHRYLAGEPLMNVVDKRAGY